jgi:hypothetical protein
LKASNRSKGFPADWLRHIRKFRDYQGNQGLDAKWAWFSSSSRHRGGRRPWWPNRRRLRRARAQARAQGVEEVERNQEGSSPAADAKRTGRIPRVNARRSSRFQCRVALRLLTRGSAAAAAQEQGVGHAHAGGSWVPFMGARGSQARPPQAAAPLVVAASASGRRLAGPRWASGWAGAGGPRRTGSGLRARPS